VDDFQIGEVGLPLMVSSCRLVPELINRLDDDKCGAGNQIMGFKQGYTKASETKYFSILVKRIANS